MSEMYKSFMWLMMSMSVQYVTAVRATCILFGAELKGTV